MDLKKKKQPPDIRYQTFLCIDNLNLFVCLRNLNIKCRIPAKTASIIDITLQVLPTRLLHKSRHNGLCARPYQKRNLPNGSLHNNNSKEKVERVWPSHKKGNNLPAIILKGTNSGKRRRGRPK